MHEGKSEFWAVGDIPGFDKVEGTSKTIGERHAHILALEGGQRRSMQIGGRYETMITINDSPWSLRVSQVGPVTLLLDPQGRILERQIPPFEAGLRNLMRFEWLDYMFQQTWVPPVLPGRVVRRGDEWGSELNILSPVGTELVLKVTSRLVGRSVGRRAGWWFHTTGLLPIRFQFDTPVGPYLVDGEIRLHMVSLFEPKAGFVTDRVTTSTVSADVSLRRDPERQPLGQSFNMHILVHAQNRFTTEMETEEEENPKEGRASAPGSQSTR
jgi:hypothetical protein